MNKHLQAKQNKVRIYCQLISKPWETRLTKHHVVQNGVIKASPNTMIEAKKIKEELENGSR